MEIKCTLDELEKAFENWNLDTKLTPQHFFKDLSPKDSAKEQAKTLINYLNNNKPHFEVINTNEL